jgi:hypothetical protein
MLYPAGDCFFRGLLVSISQDRVWRLALAAGHFIVTLHALKWMASRGVSDFDIMECGRTVEEVKIQCDGKSRVRGLDLDGDELTVICVFEGDVMVITVY